MKIKMKTFILISSLLLTSFSFAERSCSQLLVDFLKKSSETTSIITKETADVLASIDKQLIQGIDSGRIDSFKHSFLERMIQADGLVKNGENVIDISQLKSVEEKIAFIEAVIAYSFKKLGMGESDTQGVLKKYGRYMEDLVKNNDLSKLTKDGKIIAKFLELQYKLFVKEGTKGLGKEKIEILTKLRIKHFLTQRHVDTLLEGLNINSIAKVAEQAVGKLPLKADIIVNLAVNIKKILTKKLSAPLKAMSKGGSSIGRGVKLLTYDRIPFRDVVEEWSTRDIFKIYPYVSVYGRYVGLNIASIVHTGLPYYFRLPDFGIQHIPSMKRGAINGLRDILDPVSGKNIDEVIEELHQAHRRSGSLLYYYQKYHNLFPAIVGGTIGLVTLYTMFIYEPEMEESSQDTIMNSTAKQIITYLKGEGVNQEGTYVSKVKFDSDRLFDYLTSDELGGPLVLMDYQIELLSRSGESEEAHLARLREELKDFIIKE